MRRKPHALKNSTISCYRIEYYYNYFFPTDLYFSQHHKVTSPEEVLPISYGASQRSILMESVGNSPDLANENSRWVKCIFKKKELVKSYIIVPFWQTYFKLLKFLGLTNTVEWTLVKKKETVTLHLKQIGKKNHKKTMKKFINMSAR